MKWLAVLFLCSFSVSAHAQGTRVGPKIIFDGGRTIVDAGDSGKFFDTLPAVQGTQGQVMTAGANGRWVWGSASGSGTFTATTQTLSAFTVDQNNLSVNATTGIVRMSATGTVNLSGITIGTNTAGRYLQLTNIGTTNSSIIIIEDENGSSSAQNQFYIPGQTSIYMGPRGSTYWHYDGTLQKWYFDSAN